MSPDKYIRNTNCTFHIQKIETLEGRGTSYPDVTGRLSQFEFFLVTGGSGVLCVDMQKYPLNENSMYLLSPGQYRQFIQTDQMSGYFVQMPADFFSCMEPGTRYTYFDSGFSVAEQ